MPVHYPECAGEAYRPSNGTEGMMFEESFCQRCRHDDDENALCEIHTNALAFSIDEPDYPKEWVYDKDGRPTCTAFHDRLSEEPAAVARCPLTADLFEVKA